MNRQARLRMVEQVAQARPDISRVRAYQLVHSALGLCRECPRGVERQGFCPRHAEKYLSAKADHRGHVYFIQVGHAGPIKIGKTGNGTGSRWVALQSAHPTERLFLLGSVLADSPSAQEAEWHKRWARCRVHTAVGREWFWPTPDLVEAIRSACDAAEEEEIAVPRGLCVVDVAPGVRALETALSVRK